MCILQVSLHVATSSTVSLQFLSKHLDQGFATLALQDCHTSHTVSMLNKHSHLQLRQEQPQQPAAPMQLPEAYACVLDATLIQAQRQKIDNLVLGFGAQLVSVDARRWHTLETDDGRERLRKLVGFFGQSGLRTLFVATTGAKHALKKTIRDKGVC